jgi:hypothetical protein
MASELTEKIVRYETVQNPRPEAIVVHCSDPRLQAAFAQFIQRELGLRQGGYIPLVVGGGAGVLGHPEQLPKEFKFLKERFELYRDHFPSIRRLVLINHEDCKYYESLKSRVLGFMGAGLRISPTHAREDLALVSRTFKHLLSHLGVGLEIYYAKFADPEHRQIEFERVFG